ncbi:MAG: hypothetical protein JST32_10235 [Bacteroidetes bacterium]|nr:hypothetical protein [Bacteroidota bacterium]
MEKQLKPSNTSKKTPNWSFLTSSRKKWLYGVLATIIGGVIVWVLTVKFWGQDLQQGLQTTINTDNHAKTTVINSTKENNIKDKKGETAQIKAPAKPVKRLLDSAKKNPDLPTKRSITVNSLQKNVNNNSKNNHNSAFDVKGTSPDTNDNKRRSASLLKPPFDSPHEKTVVKEVVKNDTKKTDTAKVKVIPPFRPKIVPKTKLNRLVISTGADKPWIHIDSTYKYSDQYRARNLGGVYFWTDCLDCNWRIYIIDHSYNKQGVVVSNKMPNKQWLDSSIYYEFYANTPYNLIIEDGDRIVSNGNWRLIVKPGQTKIIHIGKTLPGGK